MGERMRFSLLGPLVVADVADEPVAVTGPRLRALLAALLLHANIPVPAGELADMVWDGLPPPGAVTTLRSYVRRLRAVVDPGAARITASGPGYVIRVNQAEFDILEFEALCRETRAASRAGQWADAFAAAGRALGLWRAAPLLDVPAEGLRGEFVPRLERLRIQVLEDRFEAGLGLGQHQELVQELLEVTARHPLQERFHAQLMLALAGTGRRAQALNAYHGARRVLVDELGIEPGPELRDIHQQVLAGGEPGLGLRDLHQPDLSADQTVAAIEPARHAEARPQRVTPRELPSAVPDFTGRPAELQNLTRLLDRSGELGTVVISAIGGTAGVGKTALALHWAHQVTGHFPDGQLYINLRGYDPERPVQPGDALAGFLRALGVLGTDIPAGLDERAARYRSLVAGRRMLVVLDNAGSAEQVRPLLPGTAACVTIVTSRDSLAGLVARDGARRLGLDVLPEAEAAGLLRALIGGRVDAEPDAARLLAARCCRLPLALRVAAELAVARPGESLAFLAAELADLGQRLDLLDAGGDSRSAVRAVFSWSYLRLGPDAARVFRLAGLHPGPDFDRFTVAALAATSPELAGSTLGQLARAHLIQPAARGRYAMHDLLRAYARELAEAEDGTDGGRAALSRLSGYYVHTAAAAMDALFPAESLHRARLSPPASEAPPVADPQEARAWLDAELPGLVAAVERAAYHGDPDHAIRIADTIFRALETTGRYPEIVTVYTCSLHAARRAGDLAGEAEALNNLTVVDLRHGRYQQAADTLLQSLELHEETGDHLGRARALGNLGIVRFQQGRYLEAVRYQEQALECFRRIGDQAGEPRTLNNLCIILLRQGRYQQAADGFRHALTLRPDVASECDCLANLGVALLRLGHYQDGMTSLSQALARSRETASLAREAYCLVHLGLADLRQGRCQQAADQLRRAVALSRKEGDQSGEADALNGLGEVFLAMGRPGPAHDQHSRALSLATQIGDRYEQARAHNGLGYASHAGDTPEAARRHWQDALAIYADMGVPEAGEVRVRLAAYGSPQPGDSST
jgi:DNA-binding SARP family transcriptional activator/tetratricopeptide (TPR) repeat protein